MQTPAPEFKGSLVLARWNAERQQKARRVVVNRPARRSFAAAETSRLTSSMRSDHVSINQDLEYSLRLMVGRSRNQSKNNDYVKHFLAMCIRHIVGPEGFRLHVPCLRPDGSLDVADSLLVETSFSKWSRKGVCDITGRRSFRQICNLLVLCWARDGELLLRRVRNRSGNAFGYQLQVLDPVLLDYSYRADLANGNRIRMGVETNIDGKPVAYHLLSSVEIGLGARRTRVPAEEIIHYFVAEEPDQVRGIPWTHVAMRRLHDLGGYEQAAVIAARIGASKMGFYTQQAFDANAPITADTLADDKTDEGDLIKEAEPGVFELLPEGVDFKAFDPDYPHEGYADFVKACLRGVASGLNVDYNTLANDLEGVNYSSVRHGMLETREQWMVLQNDFKEAVLEPLYSEWLEMAFVSGQLSGLPVSKFTKYDVCQWQGRRWGWVDPKADAEATVIQLDNGLMSHSAVIRARGEDPEAVFREIEKDQARLKDILPKKPKPPAASAAGATSEA